MLPMVYVYREQALSHNFGQTQTQTQTQKSRERFPGRGFWWCGSPTLMRCCYLSARAWFTTANTAFMLALRVSASSAAPV